MCLEQALSNSTEWQAYSAGVKMGCWGLVIYAATGATCSGKRPPASEPSTWAHSVTRKTDRRPAPWATGPAPAGPALRDSSRVTVHCRLEAEPAALLLGRQCCDLSAVLRADACWLPGRACQGSGRWQRCRSCALSREGGRPGSCLSAHSVSGVCRRSGWLEEISGLPWGPLCPGGQRVGVTGFRLSSGVQARLPGMGQSRS